MFYIYFDTGSLDKPIAIYQEQKKTLFGQYLVKPFSQSPTANTSPCRRRFLVHFLPCTRSRIFLLLLQIRDVTVDSKHLPEKNGQEKKKELYISRLLIYYIFQCCVQSPKFKMCEGIFSNCSIYTLWLIKTSKKYIMHRKCKIKLWI